MSRLVLALSVAFALVPSLAVATNTWPPPDGDSVNLKDPTNWPNDPGYAGQWNYWSFIGNGATNVRPGETASGISVDRAWQKTIGDRRILITVLDSGIRWNSPDLVNKFYLNAGELPVPQGCGTAPAGHDPHDVNGDGVFNVQDYTTATGHDLPDAAKICDSRVHDTNGNGFLDPQDLIAAFSDHVDDDHNGYVDDISGWDMLEDDNDPNDDTNFGHGTGESHDSSAEGNNNRDSLGVCPECTVMMIRTGDSFVVESDDFAMAVLYAVDRGTDVIQEALGALNNSSFTQRALDYAYDNGVVVVASAADEDSFHHNFPASNQHTMMVHAIRFDSEDWTTARTYLNFNNCTNYGAQLALSTPGTGCSSEATGRTSGVAGLLYSMALKTNLPAPRTFGSDPTGHRRLSGEEVKQLLITTAYDINIPDYDPRTQYPSQAGWEQRFGYGRPDVGAAVRAIEAGKIPPEVDIDRPFWFEVVYPDKQPMLPITAHIDYRKDRYQSYDWVLEYAPGVEPADTGPQWQMIAQGHNTDPVGTTMPLATWDISHVNIDNPPMPEPDKDVNRYLVTVRLRVTAHSSTLGDVNGTMRKAIHIYHDPSLLPGYPIFLGGSGESSPKMADLDGDGKRELIIADSDGKVHAFGPNGEEKAGWPKTVGQLYHIPLHKTQRAFGAGGIDQNVAAPVMATPAVGDLDGDGKPEVVIATRGGELWAYHGDGSVVTGFPVQIDMSGHPMEDPNHIVDIGFFSAPVLADLDGDKKLDIVLGAFDGQVYAFHGDGTMLAGWPVLLHDPQANSVDTGDVFAQRILSSAAIGDIDHDGHPDVVISSTEHYSGSGRIYAIQHDGTNHAGGPFLPGWPVRGIISANVLPVVGNGVPNSPALADVDGDGVPDVILVTIVGVPYVYGGDGQRMLTMQNSTFGAQADAKDSPMIVLIANPTVGDVDNDGQVDIVCPAAGFQAANAFATGGVRADFQHEVGAWNAKSGEFLPAFPRRIDDWQFFGNALIADMDNDGLPEVVQGSAGYYLHAWNKNGAEPKGWPKFTGGWIIETPAIGDMDGDGKMEIAVGTRNGWLFAWHTDGSEKGRIDWASFHHDLANTGNLQTKLDMGGTGPLKDDGGCSCNVGGRAPSGFLLVLVGLLFAWRRRRK
jgi:MYXO-CTERM domain-containing protein